MATMSMALELGWRWSCDDGTGAAAGDSPVTIVLELGMAIALWRYVAMRVVMVALGLVIALKWR